MIKRFLKQLFCRHKNSEVVCWHWTHGPNGNDTAFLEVQLKCNDCDQRYFIHIRDWDKCREIIEKHKDKEWPGFCNRMI